MISILFSLLVAALSAFAALEYGVGPGLATTAGVAGFFLAMILSARLVGKKTSPIQEELKRVMLEGQNRINRDIQQFQTKPGGNPKMMQAQVERKREAMIRQALTLVDQLDAYQKYSPLMARQMNTMKLQFYYQLKEFEKVDELLNAGFFDKPLLTEPLAVGMKMARHYKNKEIPAVEKTFKRHLKFFRGDRASLLYGVMSWVYVKEGQLDDAQKLLAKGKEKTGNETLSKNWEHLSNDREKKFSNRGLGEEWFALALENMPAPKVQRMRGRGKGPQF